MQGAPLPTGEDGSRERVLCEWDSQMPSHGMHLRSIVHRDGWLLTRYEPSTVGQPTGIERQFGDFFSHAVRRLLRRQRGRAVQRRRRSVAVAKPVERPQFRTVKTDLIADLYDHLPAERATKLLVEAPA